MKLGRKLAALASLFALLLPGLSSFSETLSAANLPGCCTAGYCPLHHRQGQDRPRDNKNCDGAGVPNSTIHQCDHSPAPLAAATAFLLAKPFSLHAPSVTESAIITARYLIPASAPVPPTPPPRPPLS